MTIPFTGDYRTFHLAYVDLVDPIPFKDRHVSSKFDRVDLLPNQLFRNLLDALAVASCLEKLNLVIPTDWERPLHYPLDDYDLLPGEVWCTWRPVDSSKVFTYINTSDAWEDLEVFIQHRSNLKVTVVRLYYKNHWTSYLEAQERLMRKMTRCLGVWDFREARVREWDLKWDFPTVKTEWGPSSDLSQDFKTLFVEVS
jgi:hypothetical protein